MSPPLCTLKDADMPQANGDQGTAWGNELRAARENKHGSLPHFQKNTQGKIVSSKTLNRYENGGRPRPTLGKEVNAHFSDVTNKEYMDSLLDEVLRGNDGSRSPRRSASISRASPQLIDLIMEGQQVDAKQEYDNSAGERLRSSSFFLLVARSGFDWIRNRHASALAYRFKNSELRSTFLFARPPDEKSQDDNSWLAARLIDATEAGGLGSHEDRVQSVLDELESLGATDETVDLFFHAYIPPYTAAVFDDCILFEPKYLSPNRKPGSQVPFMYIDRENNKGFYDYVWDDIQEVLRAACETDAKWRGSLVRPIRGPGFESGVVRR